MDRIWGCATITFLVGAGTAFAALLATPAASGEPDPSQECSLQRQPPDGNQNQCQQQGPSLPQLPNNNQNSGQQKQNRLSDFNCWMYPSGPVWPPLGSAPPPNVPGAPPAAPCYYVLGLRPTVPGS